MTFTPQKTADEEKVARARIWRVAMAVFFALVVTGASVWALQGEFGGSVQHAKVALACWIEAQRTPDACAD